jgi:hypothetical protein
MVKSNVWGDTQELAFGDVCKHLKSEGYNGWVEVLEVLHQLSTALTWQDIKRIVELYEHFAKEAERDELEWYMDEDQMGIPYPNPVTIEDLCKQTLRAFNKSKTTI